jgi:hypothetical protein
MSYWLHIAILVIAAWIIIPDPAEFLDIILVPLLLALMAVAIV